MWATLLRVVDTITEEEQIPGFLRELMPKASEPKLNEAKQNFDRYIDLLCRIALRLALDPDAARLVPEDRQMRLEFESPQVDSEE